MSDKSVLHTTMHRLLLVLTLIVCVACSSATIPLPDLNGTAPAPEISLPTPAGGTLSLSELQGKVVFVNFWGTYCPPCLDEMPDLQATYEAFAGDRFTVLAVNIEEHPDTVSSYLAENDISFPVVISDDGSINPDFAIRVLPTTWFVDAKGILRGRIEGQISATTAKSIAAQLLAENE